MTYVLYSYGLYNYNLYITMQKFMDQVLMWGLNAFALYVRISVHVPSQLHRS